MLTYSDVLALLLSDSAAIDLADRWLTSLSEDYSLAGRVTS